MKHTAKENRKRLKNIGVIVPKHYHLICDRFDTFMLVGSNLSGFLDQAVESIRAAGYYATFVGHFCLEINLDGTAGQEGASSEDEPGLEFTLRNP